MKKGDRCIGDDGRRGLVRATVATTYGGNLETAGRPTFVVNWDDGTTTIVPAHSVRAEEEASDVDQG